MHVVDVCDPKLTGRPELATAVSANGVVPSTVSGIAGNVMAWGMALAATTTETLGVFCVPDELAICTQ